MDQQKVDVRQFQIGQTLFKHFGKGVGHQVTLAHLRADKYILALHPRLTQSFAIFFFIGVKSGGVEMAVSHMQRRIDGPNTDIVMTSQRAEPDLRNAGAMGFTHLHYYLPGTAFFGWVGGGARRMPCHRGAANRGSRAWTPRRGSRRVTLEIYSRTASATTL